MTSIRRRILTPLVPLIGVASLATGIGVEQLVRRDLLSGLDRNLLVLARGVGSAVDVELGGGLEFELEGLQVLEFRDTEGGAFYRVADDSGEVLYRSDTAPEAMTARSELGPIYSDWDAGSVLYRVCTLPVFKAPEDDEEDRDEWRREHPGEPLPVPEARRFWVSVGQPKDTVDTAVAALRARLVLGLGTMTLVLVLLPTWIVTRALRPLRDLSREADRIGPESPLQRLGAGGVDREVAALAGALNRALDRLAEALERQKRFTADAAHELRTPLASLRTNCEVTLRRERSQEELRQALESTLRGVLRMAGLVEDLLALSRLQQESGMVDAEPVDLAQLARDAASMHLDTAKEKEIQLEVQLSSPIPAKGNPGLLTECVSNLLANALRHTPARGSVTLGSREGRPPNLFVRDSGSGIPEQHLGKIFDRFYRVDRGRAQRDGGAGLGLSLVREITRLHGGELEVTSTVGDGSCFTVTLPEPGPCALGAGSEGTSASPARSP